MVPLRSERGMSSVGENPMTAAHRLMGIWIDGLIKGRLSFALSPSHRRLVLGDLEFALNLSLPKRLRKMLRDEEMWCVISPFGKKKWRISVVKPEELNNPTELEALKQTYRTVIQLVAITQAQLGSSASSDEDLCTLQMEARDLFSRLPRGTQEEFKNDGLGPQTVITTPQI